MRKFFPSCGICATCREAEIRQSSSTGGPLAADPENVIALSNLAEHLAAKGRNAEEEGLWKSAVEQQPGLASLGIDLAIPYLRMGEKAAAQATLRDVLKFSPDSDKALKLQAAMAVNH